MVERCGHGARTDRKTLSRRVDMPSFRPAGLTCVVSNSTMACPDQAEDPLLAGAHMHHAWWVPLCLSGAGRGSSIISDADGHSCSSSTLAPTWRGAD